MIVPRIEVEQQNDVVVARFVLPDLASATEFARGLAYQVAHEGLDVDLNGVPVHVRGGDE